MNEVEYCRMREVEDRHWWYVTLHDLALSFIGDEFRDKGPLRMFDAGCGTGGLLVRLARFGEASGCDFSPQALALCRERGLTNVTQQDLNVPALPAASFDVITCMDVIENEWIKSDAALIARFFDALKPGGLLILNCTAFEFLRSTHDMAVGSCRRYTRCEVRDIVGRAGFQINTLSCRMFFLFAPIAVFRLAKRALHRGGDAVPASDVWLPPRAINAGLSVLGRMENSLVRKVNLPLGSSVFCVARKPA